MLEVVLVPYTLAFIALLLGISTVPLAVRGASVRTWRVHALLSVAVTAGLSLDAYRNWFAGATSWWHVALAYSANMLVPLLCAGWAARHAARWAVRAPRLTTTLAVVAVLVAGVAVGSKIYQKLLPEIIRATA